MVDNLRRSLAAPSALLLAVAPGRCRASLRSSGPVFSWAPLRYRPSSRSLDGLIPDRRGISKRSHLRAVGDDIFVAVSQALLAITMLAHQAWLMADAVVRTLGRLYFTKRNLLEWVPAAQAGYGVDPEAPRLLPAPSLGRLSRRHRGPARCRLRSREPGRGDAVHPPLGAVARHRLADQLPPTPAEVQVLSPKRRRSLRLVARRTWRFFETFVSEAENSLPPDNFQEDPEPVIAHRTSPTNLGLYLLSTTVAHDFGWIGVLDMAKRLEDTLDTMDQMRRFRGHFFNWYDTQDLRPLDPVYVSTVDSGNLAGHLIAVAQACRELVHAPSSDRKSWRTAGCARAGSRRRRRRPSSSRRTQTVTQPHLLEAAEAIAVALDDAPASLPEWVRRLEQLEASAETLLDIARALASESEEESRSESRGWSESLRDCVASHERDLEPARLLEGLIASQKAETLVGHQLSALALRAEAMVQAMDFRFLFDASRKLFSIGYRVTEGALDPSYYDLLASESRLGSFVAIAKGDVSPRHWFLLGRSLTPVGRGAALVSWSGSMFEYLMPLLVMREPAHSLLDLTSRLVVARQIQYGAERAVPWGVSESAHNIRDLELTYQYSDFGVPGLGAQARALRGRRRRTVRDRTRRHARAESRARQLRDASRKLAREASTGSTKPSTTPLRIFRRTPEWPSSGATWPITRG